MIGFPLKTFNGVNNSQKLAITEILPGTYDHAYRRNRVLVNVRIGKYILSHSIVALLDV